MPRSGPLQRAATGKPHDIASDRLRILLARPDPYLAFLLRQDLPDAEIVELRDPAALDHPSLVADLVIVDVADGAEDLAITPGINVLCITDTADRVDALDEGDHCLVRPFLPAELHRAVRRTLGLPKPPNGTRLSPQIVSWVAPVRLAAVATAAVLELARANVSPLRSVVLSLAFAYAAARFVCARGSRGAWLDVAVAAALIGSTGGIESSYFVFGVVACAQVGFVVGAGPGVLAGVVTAPAILVHPELLIGTGDTVGLALWIAAFPAAGAAGSVLERLVRPVLDTSDRVLSQANELLSTLYRIARSVPGGLELGSIASAAMAEVRDRLGAPAGVLLVGDAGALHVVGSFGLPADGSAVVDRTAELEPLLSMGGVVAGPHLPRSLGADVHECWLGAPLSRDGVSLGLVLAACADHRRHDANRMFLDQLASEASIAVENARLFDRVGHLSADAERRRLARELHDGLVQALAHVHFELGFLALHGAEDEATMRSEIERLSRVVERALTEIRSTISGLRPDVEAKGLGESLASYLQDLRGLASPEIRFDAEGSMAGLDATEAEEVFRIAQEAVSNALRHSRATSVDVSLRAVESRVRLTVSDDGAGFTPTEPVRRGMGLNAMRERASRVGGSLDIDSHPTLGTRVTFTIPAVPDIVPRRSRPRRLKETTG